MTPLRNKSLLDLAPDTSVKDGLIFIDGDTLRDTNTGESIRLSGFDSPEVFHSRDPDKPSHAAGSAVHQELSRLAREQGYTEVSRTGRKDKYGRTIGDLVNANGESFSHKVLKEGLSNTSFFSDQGHVQSSLIGAEQRASGLARGELEDEAFQNIMAANGGSFDWKTMAPTEAEYDEDLHNGVSLRRLDRTIDNKALKQFSTSFDTALMGVAEGFQGFKQMLGSVTGSEALEQSGAIGVANQRFKMMSQPKVTIDISDVKGIGDFVDYTANNAAMSIPYMANTMLAAGAGAAVGSVGGPIGAVAGAVVGLSSPTAIYSGQVYNGQEEKNAKVAFASGLAQATLDRLGLTGMTAAGKPLKGILREAEETLIAKGMTKELARKAVTDASKRELTGFFDDGLAIAAKQLSARNATRTILNRAAKGFGSEAVTEVAQEVLAQIGENWTENDFGIFDHDGFNDEFVNRITNAAVAGGTLGGAFGGAGGIREVGQWADVKHDLGKPKDGFEDILAQKEEGKGTIERRMAQMQRGAFDSVDVALRANANRENKSKYTLMERSLESIKKVPYLWRGMIRARADKDALQRSSAYRLLTAQFGGFLGGVIPGYNYESDLIFNKQKHTKPMGHEPKLWTQKYNGIADDKASSEAFSADVSRADAARIAWWEANHDRKTGQLKPGSPAFDWSPWDGKKSSMFDQISKDPNKNMMQQFFERREEMSNSMLASQNFWWMKNFKPGEKATPKFKKISNYLLRYKAMKKDEIGKHRGKFEGLLRSEYNLNQTEASDLATKILEREPLDGLDDNVFDLLMKGVPATSSKRRSMGLSENPKFAEFFHSDIFHNINEAARSAARFESYHKFVGKDNWRMAQLLDEAQRDGVPKELVDEFAMGLQNYLEAQSGNYKRPPEGSYGERALAVQKAVLTWSVATSLPLSALSSVVELSLATRALTKEQIFGRKGALSEMGFQLASMFGRGLIRYGRQSWTGTEYLPNSPEMAMNRRLGYTQWETGAATTVGATETSDWAKTFIDRFFQYNGLQGLTNTQRSIRAASFYDVMTGYIKTYKASKPDTEERRYVKEQIRNLGLDVNEYIKLIDKGVLNEKETRDLNRMEDLALYTWVNQAVALPGAANRPLFYQDPRIALFTQFNGYIAVFTANHLPQLWSQYIARGKPSIKFNTFSMMVTMIMLGYASQYLKDWLKYGEPTPYLNSQEKLRRAVNSSGMLGQGERALNFIWPTFERPASNPVEAIGGMVFDEMPAMSPLERMYKSADAFYEGDTNMGKYNLLRAMPIAGPLQGLAKELSGVEFK